MTGVLDRIDRRPVTLFEAGPTDLASQTAVAA